MPEPSSVANAGPPTGPVPADGADPKPPAVPGDRPPRRLLERPPSERFASPAAATAGASESRGSWTRAAVLGGGIAAAGAAVQLAAGVGADWTGGLLVLAVTTGLAVGLAVRSGGGSTTPASRRRLLGIALAVGAVAVALLLNWAVSPRYLGPVDYLGQVYGALVPLQLVGAAAGALVGTR